MGVVEHHHGRLGRQSRQQLLHRPVHGEAGRRRVIGQGRHLSEPGCQRGHDVAEHGSRGLQHVGGRLPHQVRQGLAPGPEARGAVVVARTPPPDPHPGHHRGIGDRLHQAGLADAGITRDHEEAAAPGAQAAHRPLEHRDLPRPADQFRPTDALDRAGALRLGGDRAGRGRRDGAPLQCRVLGDDLALELHQAGTGLDPHLLDEDLARFLVGTQGVDLATGAVAGEHEQLPPPLPVGVLGHERLEIAERVAVAALVEQGGEAVLEGGRPQLDQSLAFDLGEGVELDIGVGLPAPEGERPVEGGLGLGGSARGEEGPAPGHPGLEHRGVQVVVGDGQEVARRSGDEHRRRLAGRAIRFEDAPQQRDVRLEGRRGGGGRLSLPEVLDDPVERDDPVRIDEEPRQQGALSGSADVERLPAVEHLDRAQHPELHLTSTAWAAHADGEAYKCGAGLRTGAKRRAAAVVT